VHDPGRSQQRPGRGVRVGLIGEQPEPGVVLFMAAREKCCEHGPVTGLPGPEQQCHLAQRMSPNAWTLVVPASTGPTQYMINRIVGELLVVRWCLP